MLAASQDPPPRPQTLPVWALPGRVQALGTQGTGGKTASYCPSGGSPEGPRMSLGAFGEPQGTEPWGAGWQPRQPSSIRPSPRPASSLS